MTKENCECNENCCEKNKKNTVFDGIMKGTQEAIKFMKNRDKNILKFKKNHPNAIIPRYQNKGDAGFDFHAVIDEHNSTGKKVDFITLFPKEQIIIDTGLSCSFHEGYEMQIRPRSGIARKKGITITNSPGTIDSHFKDSIEIILYNSGNEPFIIKNGDRIAQGVMNKLPLFEIKEIKEFSEEDKKNDRGGGFGSTGKN